MFSKISQINPVILTCTIQFAGRLLHYTSLLYFYIFPIPFLQFWQDYFPSFNIRKLLSRFAYTEIPSFDSGNKQGGCLLIKHLGKIHQLVWGLITYALIRVRNAFVCEICSTNVKGNTHL